MGGCGCRKVKNNRMARLKALEKQNRTQRLNTKKSWVRPTSPDKLAQLEKSRILAICNKCPNSSQNKKEKKAGIKICHKTGRYTFAIASNPKIKCPISKF